MKLIKLTSKRNLNGSEDPVYEIVIRSDSFYSYVGFSNEVHGLCLCSETRRGWMFEYWLFDKIHTQFVSRRDVDAVYG